MRATADTSSRPARIAISSSSMAGWPCEAACPVDGRVVTPLEGFPLVDVACGWLPGFPGVTVLAGMVPPPPESGAVAVAAGSVEVGSVVGGVALAVAVTVAVAVAVEVGDGVAVDVAVAVAVGEGVGVMVGVGVGAAT